LVEAVSLALVREQTLDGAAVLEACNGGVMNSE